MTENNINDLAQELQILYDKLSDSKYTSDPEEYKKIVKRYGEIKSQLASQKQAGASYSGGQKEAIMEIRGGTGGDEASLFAQQLLRMYTKYAEKNGWKVKVLSSHRTDVGGLKEIILEISGKDAMESLEFESGVHRVQRIPETEKTGRIHTSTVSVAVLPKARPVDIEIRPEDIRIDTYRASGPGGQNVNKTSSAVRVTHIPTGMIVASQEGRLQQDNRELAMTILRSRLLQIKKDEEMKRMGEMRKQQIGTGERSEKTRTYNFPQDRITDHRIKKSWSNVQKIMDGDIDSIVKSLQEMRS